MLEAGCDEALARPIDPDRLIRYLNSPETPPPAVDEEPELGDLVRQFLSGLDQRRQAMARALRERGRKPCVTRRTRSRVPPVPWAIPP